MHFLLFDYSEFPRICSYFSHHQQTNPYVYWWDWKHCEHTMSVSHFSRIQRRKHMFHKQRYWIQAENFSCRATQMDRFKWQIMTNSKCFSSAILGNSICGNLIWTLEINNWYEKKKSRINLASKNSRFCYVVQVKPNYWNAWAKVEHRKKKWLLEKR